MTWLTLRLQRNELILLVLLAACIGAVLLTTYPEVDTYISLSTGGCPVPFVEVRQGEESFRYCPAETSRLFGNVVAAVPALTVLPVVVAILAALPVVMELAGRTYRLAWTQSQPRSVWATRRLLVTLTAAIVLSALAGGVMSWWADDFDRYFASWAHNWYDLRGVLPVGYVIFAIGLVLAIGTVVRQVIVTLVLTAVAYFLVRVPFAEAIRSHLVPSVITIEPGAPGMSVYNDPTRWSLGSTLLDPAGQRVDYQTSYDQLIDLCPSTMRVTNAAEAEVQSDRYSSCLASYGYATRLEYHPQSHYWPLQFAEAGIFAAIGLALIGWSVWYWLRRLE